MLILAFAWRGYPPTTAHTPGLCAAASSVLRLQSCEGNICWRTGGFSGSGRKGHSQETCRESWGSPRADAGGWAELLRASLLPGKLVNVPFLPSQLLSPPEASSGRQLSPLSGCKEKSTSSGWFLQSFSDSPRESPGTAFSVREKSTGGK